jgi:predicted DNA-binding transcriptional regulator YafY
VPLRRADRLFDIIRILRAASQPETAAAIADELEVTVRTVYRDVATLQARRIPIEGAAGVGYVLRRGYELPPLMFYRGRGRGHRGQGALARPPR